MIGGRVTDSRDHRTSLGQRGLYTKLIAVAVKIIDVLRHDLAFEVLPRATSDAITRIDCLTVARCLRTTCGSIV